jgi:hypothetical protein
METKKQTIEKMRSSDAAKAQMMIEKYAPTGTRITGVVVDVNKMGDKRRIRFYAPTLNKFSGKPEIVELTGYFANFLGWKTGTGPRGYGLIVEGGGMDMVFHTISTVSRAIYGDDYALKQD